MGKALISCLEDQKVEFVFGIPGVHTVELYRYLKLSKIRHITPRHEQGAGFMADGYARVTGKPGVCFLITGPGITNALTPMAQARADSIPMVVFSTINPEPETKHDYGRLHELPDQSGLLNELAVYHHRLDDPQLLPEVLNEAFNRHLNYRPGPVIIELPLNVFETAISNANVANPTETISAGPTEIEGVVKAIRKAKGITIIAGGGASKAGDQIIKLAEKLDAPLLSTVNARGIGKGHELSVPVSPSLSSARKLLEESDLVLALGTEMGPTDYEIYKHLPKIKFKNLIDVDIDSDRLLRGPNAQLSIRSDVGCFVEALLACLPNQKTKTSGIERAQGCLQETMKELSEKDRHYIEIIHTIQQEIPSCYLIGDSTQIAYAGNLYCQIHQDNGWFNAATGYGALGYSIPASIGTSLATSKASVVCLVGDGGFQFSLAELGTAVDENVPVIFIVFNNHGYGEIKNYMIDHGIDPIGVDPTPPDFNKIAQAYGMPYARVHDLSELKQALRQSYPDNTPTLIEYLETN